MENSRSHLKPSMLLLSISALVIYMIAYWIFGEKLLYNEGLGWDGLTYAAYARDFFHELTTTSDVYHVMRTFPSLVAFSLSRIFPIDLSNAQSIVLLFYIFNNILYLASAVIWYRLCKLKNFDTSIYLFGFITIFVSYTFLKYYQYAGIGTDCWAFCLGLSILYAYLKRNYVIIGVLLFPTMFSWPLGVPLVLLLVLFNQKYDTPLFKTSKKCWSLSALIIAAIYSLILIKLAKTTFLAHSWLGWTSGMGIAQNCVSLSAIIGGAYIYYLLLNLNIAAAVSGVKKIDWKITLFFITYMVAAVCFTHALTHLSINYNKTPLFNSADFLILTLTGPILKPGLFLMMHLIFYGPIFAFFMYYYKTILNISAKESYGAFLFMLCTYGLALDPHSRQLMFSFPFIIYFVSQILNEKRFASNVFLIFYFAASLLASKIYYLINVAPMPDSVLAYPFQRFFMNFGLWTMWPGYFFNLELSIAIGILLYLGIKFSKNNQAKGFIMNI